jgi:hypothetical protein
VIPLFSAEAEEVLLGVLMIDLQTEAAARGQGAAQ